MGGNETHTVTATHSHGHDNKIENQLPRIAKLSYADVDAFRVKHRKRYRALKHLDYERAPCAAGW